MVLPSKTNIRERCSLTLFLPQRQASIGKMKSQLRFIMHPDDENEFMSEVLSDPTVLLIDGPRWKAEQPETFRSLSSINNYCIIWSPQDRTMLSARHIPTCEDWYCSSEEVTIQFLRSRLVGSTLTEGRIAVGTNNIPEAESAGVERRYKALSRFLKKRYTNAVLRWQNSSLPFTEGTQGRSANPSMPDKQLWVGPHALHWLQESKGRSIRQFLEGNVEAVLDKTAVR